MLRTVKTCKWLICAIEILLVIVLTINLITAVLSATDLRTRLGWMPYAAMCVQGGSMAPSFSEGDLLVVHEVPYEALTVGDDVTFWTVNGFVTHRIVGVRNGEYITRGEANQIDDLDTMGPESYCGKVLLCVPYLGHVVQFLSRYNTVILIVALAGLLACLAMPFIKKRREKAVSAGAGRGIPVKVRVLVLLNVLGMLVSLPYMTDAKYIGQINRFDAAVAQPLYFSSNYLSRGQGNTYSIQGWNGEPYSLSLQIRNFDNALLYNEEGLAVAYGFGVRIHTEDGSTDNYTVTIQPSDEEITPLAADDFVFPETWASAGIVAGSAYEIPGGTKNSQNFSVTIKPKEGDRLPAKTKVYFEIFATTEKEKNYFLQLQGAFKLQVAEVFEFIGERRVADLPSMVDLSVKTNLINDGSDEKIVVFKWDPNKVYINEFESTVFNVITNNPTYYRKDSGLLYMRMQAYSRVNLEFFKKVAFEASVDDFVVQVVENVGDPPTIPADPEPEETTTE